MSSNLYDTSGAIIGQDTAESAPAGSWRVFSCGGDRRDEPVGSAPAGSSVLAEDAPSGVEDPTSLGNVHISARVQALRFLEDRTFRARARFLPGGVHASAPGNRPAPPPGVKRGEITGFSASSRRRLRLSLMGVEWGLVDSYWVTLTYHRVWGAEWQEWKRDLRAFHKALDRRFPTLGDYWRLEFQRRGAPHFHLVLAYGLGEGPGLDILRDWVSRTWARIIGEECNRAHLSFGTCTVHVDRSADEHLGALLGYMVKEMCKVRQSGGRSGTGRHWGQRGELPTRVLAEVDLTDEGYAELASRVAATGFGWLADNLSGAWPGFVVLGSGRSMLDGLLDGLPGGVRFVGGEGPPEDG